MSRARATTASRVSGVRSRRAPDAGTPKQAPRRVAEQKCDRRRLRVIQRPAGVVYRPDPFGKSVRLQFARDLVRLSQYGDAAPNRR